MASLYVFISCLCLTAVTAQFFSPAKGLCELLTEAASCYRGQECRDGYQKHNPLGFGALKLYACGGTWYTCCEPASPPVDEETCGLGGPAGPQARILRGTETRDCEYPWIVSVRVRNAPGITQLTQDSTSHVCAGVIIDEKWILTSASCALAAFEPLADISSTHLIVAGEIDTASQEASEQVFAVEKGFLYPSFVNVTSLGQLPLNDPRLNENALALIKLAGSGIRFGNCAQPVCLPFASSVTNKDCDSFTQCTILGWGFTSADYTPLNTKLKQGDVNIYKKDVCNFLQNNYYPSETTRYANSACQISSAGQDGCLFDQGGPVVCYDGFRWSVEAVIPLNFCQDGQVSPYVINVDEDHKDWIYNTLRNN